MKFVLMFVASFFLFGCASSHVLVGQARAPILAENVRLYVEPPPRYETVALLEASNRNALNFTDQQRTNTVIARMKEEAAALGANGILIQGMGSQYAGSIGSGNAWASGNQAFGVGFSSAIMNRTGNGLAIYVPSDAHGDGMTGYAPVAQASQAENQGQVEANAAPAVTHPSAPVAPVAPAAALQQPHQLDPAKRCDACQRLTSPRGGSPVR